MIQFQKISQVRLNEITSIIIFQNAMESEARPPPQSGLFHVITSLVCHKNMYRMRRHLFTFVLESKLDMSFLSNANDNDIGTKLTKRANVIVPTHVPLDSLNFVVIEIKLLNTSSIVIKFPLPLFTSFRTHSMNTCTTPIIVQINR